MTYKKEEILEKICERLMTGDSLRTICLSDDMPAKSTVLGWLNENDEFAALIARARDLQADALFDDMTDLVNRMLAGEFDATTARTAIWAKQWQASKLKPKKYGDKITQEHTGPDGSTPVFRMEIEYVTSENPDTGEAG